MLLVSGEDSEGTWKTREKGKVEMTSVLTRRKVRYKGSGTDLYSSTRPNWGMIENIYGRARSCMEKRMKKGRSS